MEFCRNSKCPFIDCADHPSHAPFGFAFTAVAKDEECQRWKEREDKRRRMTGGDAFLIFQNIDTVPYFEAHDRARPDRGPGREDRHLLCGEQADKGRVRRPH